MKATKAQRQFCKRVINKWRSRMFLGEWFIDLVFESADMDSQPGGRPSATCWADPVYMQATITVYPCFWNAPIDRRIHMLVHEMAHCHTQSMWNVAKCLHMGELITPDNIRCEIENLTQRIANIAYQQEWSK